MATHYKDLGLVNTKVMFQMAMEGGFAVPAYNFNNLEQLQAVIWACVESDSPVMALAALFHLGHTRRL